MADAAEKEKPKIVSTRPSFMFLHGEKIALGFAGLVLAGYGVFCMISGDDSTLQDAASARQKITGDTEEYKKKIEATKARYKDFDSQAQWKTVSHSSVAPKSWSMAWMSKIEVFEREPDKPKVTTVAKLPDVEIDTLDSVLGAVTGTFKFKPVEPKVIDQLNRIEAAKLAAFKVERRTLDEKAPAAEKDWAEILSIAWDEKKPPDLKFSDKTIRPKTLYEYRMTPFTEQKGYKRETEVLEIESAKYSEAKKLRTVGYFSWKLGGAVDGVKGLQISIEITKYDPESNDNYTKRWNFSEGDVIGGHPDDPTAEEPKTVFEAEATGAKSGKKKVINFNTQCKLLKLESGVKREIPYRVCKVVGGKCQGPEVKRRTWNGTHVVILNDENEKQEFFRPDLPKVEDKLCPDHENLKGTPVDEAPPKAPGATPPAPPKSP